MTNQFVERVHEAAEDSAGVGPHALSAIFGGSSIEDDDAVAEAIMLLMDEYPTAVNGLENLIRAIEWLPESRVSLDMAIKALYFAEVREGVDSTVASTRLSTRFPDLDDRIRRAIQSAKEIAEAVASVGMVRKLPMEFGRMERDMRARYELRELLGAGAQGAVYLAVDRRFDESIRPAFVAIKICRFDMSGEDEAVRARAINHNNVARVVDRGLEAGLPYIVYELIDGVPLDDWIDQHPHASWYERCEIVAQIADGVQAAHASGVIHRDLKPSNILVRPDGTPVITDFGISCLNTDGRSFAYQTRDTVLFLSPEQYKRSPLGMAPTTDVYALGGLLMWLMTGRHPNGRDVEEAVQALEQDQVVFDRHDEVSLGPKRMRAVWQRALAVETTQRHRSAEQFAADVRAVMEHEPIAWLDRSSASRVPLMIRKNALVSGLVAVIMLMLVGSTWAVTHTRAQARIQRADMVIQEQKRQILTAQEYLDDLMKVLHESGFNTGMN